MRHPYSHEKERNETEEAKMLKLGRHVIHDIIAEMLPYGKDVVVRECLGMLKYGEMHL